MNTLSNITTLYFEARQAQRYSPNTLNEYRYTFRRFAEWLGDDKPVNEIDAKTIRGFMASTTDVSKKTSLNYHIGLSSLWQWMTENELVERNIVRQVKPPKPEVREIVPYTEIEIRSLLIAAQGGRLAARDQAIIMILLDTGIRATELCKLRLTDISFTNRQILVFGKGSKERRLRISPTTVAAIQKYKTSKHTTFLLTDHQQPWTRQALRLTLVRLGKRASVLHCNVHRFRHTFAIESLRNGINIYALQKALGHTTLDMVKRYLLILQTDLDNQMDRSSPVMAWNL